MTKEEITSLKEEIFKEIRTVEQKINLQLLLKSRELEEKNKIFLDEFKVMIEKQKALQSSITNQNIYINKITDLENFRKRYEDMTITHEVRISNIMKDIQGINFKIGKDISEIITVPGFVGPSCKYKTIQSYISSNISEIDRIKSDYDSHKKDTKDLKKKMDEIIKTTLNLVDNSSSKYIQYVDNKYKSQNEFINQKMDEFNEKIIKLRTLLMTQEKMKEFDNKFENIENNYYTKKDVDDLVNNVIDNFNINLENFKIKCDDEINILLKINNDKIENIIKETHKSIKDLKAKINKINEVQNQLLKHSVSMSNMIKSNTINNNNDTYLSKNNKRKINVKNNNLRNGKGGEEAQLKLREYNSGSKIDDSFQIEESDEENNNISNVGIYKYNTININNDEKNIIESSNNSLTKSGNSPIINNKFYSEDNKNNINEYNNKINKSKSKDKNSNKSFYKTSSIDKDINSSPYYTSSAKKKRKNDKNYHKKTISFRREFNNHLLNIGINKNIHNKLNLFSNNNNNNNINDNNNNNNLKNNYNNPKSVVNSIETIDNNNNYNNNNEKDNINDNSNNSNDNNIINDNNAPLIESINNNQNKKARKYSLHELASMNFDEKANEILPNMKSFTRSNHLHKTGSIHTPIIKNVFQQNYLLNLKNYKLKQNLTINTPVKITSSFGRTGYTFYDKKEEGIKNLINIGIKKRLKTVKTKTINFKFELSPVSKIKLYENI